MNKRIGGLLFSYRFNGWKRAKNFAPGSADNFEFATPDGTPSWTTWNIYLSYQVVPSVSHSGRMREYIRQTLSYFCQRTVCSWEEY